MNLGKDVRVELGGREWIIKKITIDVLFEFRDWIAEKIGDPLATAERFIDKLPAEQAMELVREGERVKMELDQFNPEGELATKWLQTPEGSVVFSWLVLRRGQDVKLDQVAELMTHYADELAEAFAKAQGQGAGSGSPFPTASPLPARGKSA